MTDFPKAHTDGHFYSPVIDPREVLAEANRIWPENPEAVGIDFDNDRMRDFIDITMRKYMPDYNYPEDLEPGQPETSYYENNSEFGFVDSRSLFAMIRDRQPSTMVEIGSGYSSLITADVNHNYLNDSINFILVEPYPRDLLVGGLPGINTLLQKRIQDILPETFEQLGPGDILFIDSSHVVKTGSDATYIYLEILPRLNPGVIVHVHDIYIPGDYRRDWIELGRSWNENYILQAMLAHNPRYKVIFGSHVAVQRFPELLLEVGGPRARAGGSFWFEVCEQ